MLTSKDLERLRDLVELDQRGLLEEYVIDVVCERRAQGLGRLRDPRDLPFLTTVLRAYEQVYQPPRPPTSAEVIHALFPGPPTEIADSVLRWKIGELKASAGKGGRLPGSSQR